MRKLFVYMFTPVFVITLIIGSFLLLIINLLIAPYAFLRSAVTEQVRWHSQTPKLILQKVEDTGGSEVHLFRQEMERLIPIGSPLVYAETILKRNGFKLVKGFENEQSFLHAVKQTGFLPIPWVWHAYFTYDDADQCITTMNCGSYSARV